MKLINDMVSGIRTIKCYAWETHYMKKIRDIRGIQKGFILKQNIIGGLGFSVYS